MTGFLVAFAAVVGGPMVALVNLTDGPDVRVWAPALLVGAVGAALGYWSYAPVHLELTADRLRIRPVRAGRAAREVLFTQVARCRPPSASPVEAMLLQAYDGPKMRFSRLSPPQPPFINIEHWAHELVVRVEQVRAAEPAAQAARWEKMAGGRSFGRSVVGTGLAVVAGLLLLLAARKWLLLPGKEGPPWWLVAGLVLYLAYYVRARLAAR